MIKLININDVENQALFRGLFSISAQSKIGKRDKNKLLIKSEDYLYLMSEVSRLDPRAIDMYNSVGAMFCGKYKCVYLVM
jgi:hypothetical protein